MSEHAIALSRRTFIAGGLATMAATGLLSAHPTEAFAVTSDQKKAEAAEALSKLDALQQKLDLASDDLVAARLEKEEAQAKMEEAQGKIDEASEKIVDLQDKLGTRARGMYRSGSFSFLDVLLSATTFQAFTTNWDTLNQMNENDSAMVEETKSLKAEVEAQKAEYAEQERVAAQKEAEAEKTTTEAQALVDEMQATYDSLSAEVAQLMEAERQAREAQALREAQATYGTDDDTTPSNPSSNGSSNGSSSSGGHAPSPGGSDWKSRAESLLGTPYDYGAGGPSPIDCSGFVGYALTGRFGHPLGDSRNMATFPRVSEPYPGCICVKPGHVALYYGNGQLIHANGYGYGVQITAMGSGYTFHRY